MIKANKKEKGFTLIEMLVSILIFSIISAGLINVFIAAVQSQSRVLQNQSLMEQSSYSLEYMGKLIRMANMDTTGGCTGVVNTNYSIAQAPNSITFLAYDAVNSQYRCRQFLLSNNIIEERRSSDATVANLEPATEITSSQVKVNKLKFVVTGDVLTSAQPKVTIMVKMESARNTSNPPQISVETSVSQRHLNIVQ